MKTKKLALIIGFSAAFLFLAVLTGGGMSIGMKNGSPNRSPCWNKILL